VGAAAVQGAERVVAQRSVDDELLEPVDSVDETLNRGGELHSTLRDVRRDRVGEVRWRRRVPP
jgi:hypothetical protein